MQNSNRGRIVIDKRKKLLNWIEEFNDAKEHIKTFIKSLKSEFMREVASFAEDNYDNSRADEKWKKILDNHNIESRAVNVLEELANECENELNEICREIYAELKFSHTIFNDKTIKMPYIIDAYTMRNKRICSMCRE